ncbi:TKL protein kinase [Phytophthora cinnamomi]|uniref:TKL protein kinase n=1 Tax=Phytophthora cinnamomi TaxID=4785 RepID=UPI00355A9DB8|nr:TKL protein kinase [Phytophthora cinnamomi]
MQRRRRRLLSMATLLSSPSLAREWAAGRDCRARCAAPLCLVSPDDGACLALNLSETVGEWRVTLDAYNYSFGAVELPPDVQTLELQGDKTRVQFDAASRWTGERLAALLFIGLDLTNASLPKLPDSITQLHIVDCALSSVPVTWLLALPNLETLVLTDNSLVEETRTLTQLSERQFKWLSTRLSSDSSVIIQEEAEAGEAKTADCIDVRAGRVQRLGGWQVCVVSDEVAVARRLKTSANSGSGESQSSDTMDGASRGSKSAADQDTSTLVLLSMGLPFVYFLYKLGLFFFFMLTYKRNRSESGEVSRVNTTKDSAIDAAHDSERDRPTANDSSTSPPPTPSPRVHRRQDKKPFSSNNAGFWVDEELQPWRLDFQRLKMIKSLNLLPTENRQTLRKQSVTSVMNPREIWLASYWSGKHSAVAVSPGGGTTDTLVVAKFIAPREDQGPRSSASGNGGGARDKLKGELKRQAVFSHPQVVAFVGVAWSRETHLVAVTEYMAQGDLRQWLHRTASQVGKWSVQKVQMLLDVSRALLYLHSMHPRLVHGNCNSRNVLLDDALRAKLSDYGVDGRTDGLTEQELMSYSAVGSGRWISPEALLGRETSSSYPDASDVYSFGILIAEMDSHELPFSDLMQANRSAVPETDILQLIAKGALTPTLSPECPKSIVKLVNACTSYKPKYRPSSTQVQQDLLRTLNDFREVEGKVTTISVGAPRSNPPSNFV